MSVPKYLLATASYGFVRGCCRVSKGTLTKYDHENRCEKQIPLLYVDKAAISLLSSVISPYVWPMYLWTDLAYLEVCLDKTKDPKMYSLNKEKKYYYDYIFT